MWLNLNFYKIRQMESYVTSFTPVHRGLVTSVSCFPSLFVALLWCSSQSSSLPPSSLLFAFLQSHGPRLSCLEHLKAFSWQFSGVRVFLFLCDITSHNPNCIPGLIFLRYNVREICIHEAQDWREAVNPECWSSLNFSLFFSQTRGLGLPNP